MVEFLPQNMILSLDFRIGILRETDFYEAVKAVKDKIREEKVVDYMVTSRSFFEDDDDCRHRIGIAVTESGDVLCFDDYDVRRAVEIAGVLCAEDDEPHIKHIIDGGSVHALILDNGYIMSVGACGNFVLVEGRKTLCPYRGKILLSDEHG